MANGEAQATTRVRIPVRSGPYQYVLVRADGTTSTVRVGEAARDADAADVDVAAGDRIIEIALKSTSDPDLDPPRGQLWPAEGAR